MKKVNRKSQVDVALTIGSIIVPIGAIFGALIFAWAMIGPINDAAKLAAVISYDVATLSDVAYSVPDDIRIRYIPPTECNLVDRTGSENFPQLGQDDYLNCLNGFMNITGFGYKIDVRKTETISHDKIDFMYSLESTIAVALDPSKVVDDEGKPIDQPFIVSYPAFGNMKDLGILNAGSRAPLKVDGGVIIEKRRPNLYDTLYSVARPDPMQEIIEKSFSACNTESDISNLFIVIPQNYYFNRLSATELCLMKRAYLPYPDSDVDPELTANHYTVYCFDFKEYGKCTFDLLPLTVYDTDCAADRNCIGTPLPVEKCALININFDDTTGDCATTPCITYDSVTHDLDGNPLC